MSSTHSRRLSARPPAGLGRGQGLRLPGRRHQRHARRLGPRRRRAASSSRPGTRRWPPSRRSATRSSPAGSGCAWPPPGPGAIHLLNGLYDAKLDHVPGGGHRRPDQPQRDGRLLPAGGRPAQPVQGRRQRVRADGHRARAAAQRPRPGDPHRAGRARRRPRSSSRPTSRSSSTPRPPTRSRWCPPASGIDWPTAVARRRRPSRGAAERAQRRQQGRHPGRPGRPRRAARRSSEVADLLGAGVAKALLGKDVAVRRAAVRHRLDRAAGHPAQLRDDEGLRHPADRRLELPVHPVHAGLRAGAAPCRSTSTRTVIGMRYPYEVNLVGDAAATLRALHPAAGAQAGPVLARDDRDERRPLVGGHGRRGRRSPPTRSTRCGCSPSCRRGCPTTRSSPPTPARRPTGTPGS